MAKNIKQQIDITARNKTAAGFKSATKQANLFARSLSRIQTSVIGIFAFRIAESFRVGIGSIVSMSDSVIELDAKMKLATETTEELADAEQRLVEISLKTGSALDANTALFAKLNRPVKALGFVYDDTLKITDALSKSLRISGATTNQTESATLQFTQALESGIIAGDEFRSLNENAPRLLQAVADSLGITRGELRAMSKEQKLTAEVVIPAILDQYGKLGEEVATLPLTIGRAWQNLLTELRVMFKESGELNSGVASAISAVGGAVKILTENLGLLTFTFAAALSAASLHFLDNIRTKIIANVAARKSEIASLEKTRRAENRRAADKAKADIVEKKASFDKAEASVVAQENILKERTSLISKSEATTRATLASSRKAVVEAKAHVESVKANEAERKQTLLLSNEKSEAFRKTVVQNVELKIQAADRKIDTQEQALVELKIANQRKTQHALHKIRAAEQSILDGKKLLATQQQALAEATTDKQKAIISARTQALKVKQVALEGSLATANTNRTNVEVANANKVQAAIAKTENAKASRLALNARLKTASASLTATEIANVKKLEKLTISSQKRVATAEKAVEVARRKVVAAAKKGGADIVAINAQMAASEKALSVAIVKRFETESALRAANSTGIKTEAAIRASNLAAQTTGLQKMASAVGLVTKAEGEALRGRKLFRQGFAQSKRDIKGFVGGLRSGRKQVKLLNGSVKLLGGTIRSTFGFLFGLPGLFILAISPFIGKLFDVEVAWIALSSTIKRSGAELITLLARVFNIANLQEWLATINTAEEDLRQLAADRKAREAGFLDEADRIANELNALRSSEVTTAKGLAEQEKVILDGKLEANQRYLDQRKDAINTSFAEEELALRLSLINQSLSEEEFQTKSEIGLKDINDRRAEANFKHQTSELEALDEFHTSQIEKADAAGKSSLKLRTERNVAIRDKSQEILDDQVEDLDRLEDEFKSHISRMNGFDDQRAAYRKDTTDFINGLTDARSAKEQSAGDITLEVSNAVRKLGELDTIDRQNNSKKVFKIFDDTISSLKDQAQKASDLADSVEKGSVKEADALAAKEFALSSLKTTTEEAATAAEQFSDFEESQAEAVKKQINDRTLALSEYRSKIVEIDKLLTLQRVMLVDLKIDPALAKLDTLEKKLAQIQQQVQRVQSADLTFEASKEPLFATSIEAVQLPERATGGGFERVKGKVPGSGSGDKIKALLEPEEFVINRNAVSTYGTDFFRLINSSVPRFQFGGSVGGQSHEAKVSNRIDAMKESYLARTSEWKGVYDSTGDIADFNRWQSVKLRAEDMIQQLSGASDIGLDGLRRLHEVNGNILQLATSDVVTELSLVDDSNSAGNQSGIGNTAFVASQFSNNELKLFTDLLPDLQEQQQSILSTKFTPPNIPTIEPEPGLEPGLEPEDGLSQGSSSTTGGLTSPTQLTPEQANEELIQQLIRLGTSTGGNDIAPSDSSDVITVELKAGASSVRLVGDRSTTEPFLEELRAIQAVS